ncbi:MAG: hypothetical protein M1819_006648 [Sarea resinae]|nr:MAG: hypothetical protein M1819_006648 [Sarea resinae]
MATTAASTTAMEIANCPVCEHSPISAEDCKPHKAMRTTIKVYLRTKEKQRESVKHGERSQGSAKPLPAPASSSNDPSTTTTAVEPVAAKEVPIQSQTPIDDAKPKDSAQDVIVNGAQESEEAQKDIPRPSIEATDGTVDPNASVVSTAPDAQISEPKNAQAHASEEQSSRVGQKQEQGVQWNPTQMQAENFSGGFAFDGSNGGFPNMGWNGPGDFNQMMQGMPNGMQNSWGGFPNMMGMPGMNMDPTAMSQGMYGGFDGQGMGMNGMSMGMGYGAGQGGFGGWDGQPGAWSGGQDKFIPNSNGGHASGMGNDFGAFAGYHPGGGYNLQSRHDNFSQMHHPQYSNNNFQNSFNGQSYPPRDDGSRRQSTGNGGQIRNASVHNVEGNDAAFSHQLPVGFDSIDSTQQLAHGGEPNAMPKETEKQPTEADQNHIFTGDDEQDTAGSNVADAPNANTAPSPMNITGQGVQEEEGKSIIAEEAAKPVPIESVMNTPAAQLNGIDAQFTAPTGTIGMTPPTGPAIPLGPAGFHHADTQPFGGRGRGFTRGYIRGGFDYRGGMRGRGASFLPNGSLIGPHVPHSNLPTDFPGVVPIAPKGVGVEGAPKAPKALREGLPNTGLRGGRGAFMAGRAGFPTAMPPTGPAAMATPGTPVAPAVKAASTAPSATVKSRSRSPEKPRSKSRSRTRSRSPERRHRHQQHNSPSSSINDDERERKREKRHHRSKKYTDGEIENGKERIARSRSASSSRRSTHNSRHDKERHTSHKHRSSHRSHRDRSGDHSRRRRRSRSAADRPIAEDAKLEKEYSSRNRDREKKRSQRAPSDLSDEGSDHERSYRSRRSKREKRDSERTREKEKEKDKACQPDNHTLEREARNRERLLKEQERRQSLNQERERKDRERKRGRDPDEGDGDDVRGDGHRSRRNGTKSSLSRRDSEREEPGEGKRRRVSYKYDDEENEEARAIRVENEREAARWG